MKKTLIALTIMLVATAAFADGLFVQSDMYPVQKVQSFNEQLGLKAGAVTNPMENIDDDTAEYSVSQASGNPNYPVTPGDVYTLTYYSGSTLVTETISVDSKINVQVPFVGQINAKGMKYIDFKDYVERTVTGLYSYSKPQLTIRRCGLFSVNVSGQVKYSRDVQVWGLTKLSDLSMYATDFASTRKVCVTYSDGTEKCYDLFNAMMNSDSASNPLLEPGCNVRFELADTTVTLSGLARRTGTFQTLEGQTLADLISQYGRGLQNSADTRQATVTRYSDGTFQTDLVKLEDAGRYILRDGDSVQIRSASQQMPYVVIEGALSATGSSDTSAKSASTRIMYQFFPGETSSQLICNIADKFIQSTDTAGIYLTRADGTVINLNADDVLTSKPVEEVLLEQGDVVTVPYSRQTVTVSGAVASPGSYAYVAGKDYQYYVDLAGGYTADAYKISTKVTDNAGAKVKLAEKIGAGSNISIQRRNTNLYNNIILVTAGIALGTAIYELATGTK